MKLTALAEDLSAKIATAQDNETREQIIKDWFLAQQEAVVAMYAEQDTIPIVRNQVAPGDLAIGDYVFVSRWSDCDPADPWAVGHISEIGENFIVVGDVSPRWWRKAMRITEEQGRSIIEQYPLMEANLASFNYKTIAQIFGMSVTSNSIES